MLNNANDSLVSIQNTNFNNEIKQTVNARELWEKLEVKSKFADWIKNNIQDFIENIDFITISKNLENGGRSIEYYLSIEMAKHLCMLARTEQGKQIRKYFIACEQQLKEPKQLPTQAELTLQLAGVVVDLEKKLINIQTENKELIENQDLQHKEILKLQNTINRNITSNNFTVIAYANLNKIKPSQYRASQLGRYASKLCREKGLITGLVVDSKYGAIKTYPVDILEETFKNFGL